MKVRQCLLVPLIFSLLLIAGCGSKMRAGEDIGKRFGCLDSAKNVELAYGKTPDHYSLVWKDTGTIYQIIPKKTYQKDGKTCRDTEIIATKNGQPPKQITHTACCDDCGNWYTDGDSLSANSNAPRYRGEFCFIRWEYHMEQQKRKFLINEKKRIQ